ncbi:DEAD/DEAH box helicase [Corynebacterium xerosis]|uniref:DEAD/DEAH box helicase n=1 Tax=Corynebacterium xerosis TaxID=1725 RepID=A0A7X9SUN4_9CORY|nr:DEAD/DEAH box helicase [Corynebacterium xerosis]NMF08290.1 DEAD/DEAH box helicase [Corynebacterium xerosis]
MSTVSEVLSALREFPSNSERGTAFEKLMVRYFQMHPILGQEYDQVCRWVDWEFRDNRSDAGIDLVARNREKQTWTAIQCKFYEPTHHLAKRDLDSFFTESGRGFHTPEGIRHFTNRIIVSTTDRWGKNAEESLAEQAIPVQRFGLADIAEAPLDWDIVYPGSDVEPRFELSKRELFQPRPHQQEAIDRAIEGFAAHDRGKLIMACGTGKTFTALKLAEQFARANVSPFGTTGRVRVLFCVPSISLLSQTLREWTANAELDLRSFAVCSDTKVSRAAEDISAYDLEIPVTTNGRTLAEEMNKGGKRLSGLQVVFSTYQSLPTIHDAQEQGAPTFDLIICDEAHRTTGITMAGEDPSHFTRVHDASYIRGAKRLYMTATPRLFDDKVKDKAADFSAEVSSMDDEAIFGPEFHRLGFGEAVEKGLLTDYKVLVLAVDEEVAAETTQRSVTDSDGMLTLDDTSKIIGCWNGLAKRSGRDQDGKDGFESAEAPMQRAVAFARDIKSSEHFTEAFPYVTENFAESLREKAAANDMRATPVSDHNLDLRLEAQHVDGGMNALTRGEKLAWLKAPVPDNECRILTNARCLSEGVDVPALDAVLFLNPRNSVVDVVQSVGRVMRKSPDKKYGYIILPVGVPAGMEPSRALADNRRFKVVWQVLNALRAHDDRFNAMVNSVALNAQRSPAAESDTLPFDPNADLKKKLDVDFIGREDDTIADDERGQRAVQAALFSLEEWQEAIYTRIVDKVGDRTYWEDWADDVAGIADAQIARIKALLGGANEEVRGEFDTFVEGLRGNLNDSISQDDAISMLSQHLITAPVFDALFAEHDFASHNPVSRVMQRMVDALDDSELGAETQKLEKFYRSVRVRAAEVTSAAGKQAVIKDLYERFFRKAFRKQSEALGIVYTPVEIVDFILRAADEVAKKHFGKGLSDDGVHILDPFTGTGTFMVRLLQSGLIKPEDLARKYAGELHATEIMLLAYYVAAVNIETTFHALETERAVRDDTDAPEYEPFGGIALADTFQVYEEDDELDLNVFTNNNERIERQKQSPIHVIIGNPPYSVGQTSANDLNANLKYPTLDRRIEETYAVKSTATNKNSLYDSYFRAFRWATDRVKDNGIVAFVSNGGWIDGNTGDGVRLSFAEDFSDIYVFNLRGNQRTAGEQSRKEGGKVFGSGSRATVAITIGVKRADGDHSPCSIHYRDIGDYLSTEEKLRIVGSSTLGTVDWQKITPNDHGDWINQRNADFETWPVLGQKRGPKGSDVFFSQFSAGLQTNRDAWVYNFNRPQLRASVQTLIESFSNASKAFEDWFKSHGNTRSESAVTDFLKKVPGFEDPTQIKWSRSLRNHLAKTINIDLDDNGFTAALYRPFCVQHSYFNRHLNHERGQLPSIFPTPMHDNVGVLVNSRGSAAPFTVSATRLIPDLQSAAGAGNPVQFFPRWTWEPISAAEGELELGSSSSDWDGTPGTAGEVIDGYRRVDNITDEIHGIYREALGDDVTKDDIFYFVYGQLHDPDYRETYAADLKKMLPHIETPSSRERFDQLAVAGRELMDLHVNYEKVEPYPLEVVVKHTADPEDRENWRVTKLKWKRARNPETKKLEDDRTEMIYNSKVTIKGIPLEADEYMLGSRSALAWIIDRYQVKRDKASGIVNDPNDWCDEVGNPRYIVDLIGKVTRVAVETVRIVEGLRQK